MKRVLLFLILISANLDREKRGMSVYEPRQRTASLIIRTHSYVDKYYVNPQKEG